MALKSTEPPWDLLCRYEFGCHIASLDGHVLDLSVFLGDWMANGHLVGEVYRLHLSYAVGEQPPALVQGSRFQRYRVADHLAVVDGHYAVPTTGLADVPEACFMAVGLPAATQVYVWTVGYRCEPRPYYIFVVDESDGVEWICDEVIDESTRDPDLIDDDDDDLDETDEEEILNDLRQILGDDSFGREASDSDRG